MWKVPVNTLQKTVYLTFDDGPVPAVTEFVLKTLHAYQAKATFFCVGDNIRKHPHIFEQIILNGHSVGNHTHNHIKGWKNTNIQYLQNIALCDDEIRKQTVLPTNKPLFRPPYGQIKRSQIAALTPHYDIVMWSLLTGDFDKNLNKERCLINSIKATENGTITVFHDSYKAADNLYFLLPKYIEQLSERGYQFKSIGQPTV